MNYLSQKNGFWRSHEEHSFGTTEVALYFYLLEVCDKCGYKNPFKRNNAKIEADLSISFNTLKNARNKLHQAGLLAFKTTSGSPGVLYTLSYFDRVAAVVGNEVGAEVTVEVANGVLSAKIKRKENKTKKDIPPLPPAGERAPKKDFDFSFVENDFSDAFFEWLDYKKAKGQAYKSQNSLEICYRNLKKLAGGRRENAKLIAEQSIANNWNGLFELKNSKNDAISRISLPKNIVYEGDTV
jgi:hypothetical protein